MTRYRKSESNKSLEIGCDHVNLTCPAMSISLRLWALRSYFNDSNRSLSIDVVNWNVILRIYGIHNFIFNLIYIYRGPGNFYANITNLINTLVLKYSLRSPIYYLFLDVLNWILVLFNHQNHNILLKFYYFIFWIMF